MFPYSTSVMETIFVEIAQSIIISLGPGILGVVELHVGVATCELLAASCRKSELRFGSLRCKFPLFLVRIKARCITFFIILPTC